MCLSRSFNVKLLSRVWLFAIPWTVKPTRLLHPRNFPGRSTGVGCLFLLQGIFLTQGSNPGVQHCRQMPYLLSHQGSPGAKYSFKSHGKLMIFSHPFSLSPFLPFSLSVPSAILSFLSVFLVLSFHIFDSLSSSSFNQLFFPLFWDKQEVSLEISQRPNSRARFGKMNFKSNKSYTTGNASSQIAVYCL